MADGTASRSSSSSGSAIGGKVVFADTPAENVVVDDDGDPNYVDDDSGKGGEGGSRSEPPQPVLVSSPPLGAVAPTTPTATTTAVTEACITEDVLPIPLLLHAFERLKDVEAKTRRIQHNKHSIRRLILRSSRILASVESYARRERDRPPSPEPPGLPENIAAFVKALMGVLESVDDFVQKHATKKFMQHFVNRQSTAAKLQLLHRELASIAQDLSLSLQLDARAWAEEDKADREADVADMDFTLQHLVDNDYKILNALELKQQEYLEAMEALQKNLADHVDRSLERNLERLFMERALTCLRRASQTLAPTVVHDWVITSWEIEIGDVMNRGGFGEVAKATWLGHTSVAVKRLLIRLDTNRLKEDFYREVRTWYPLRHPHVLPLLGACATADRPFMVSPFMEGGHAIQYLDNHPNDMVKAASLLYEISQGMQYLHSRHVIHGDLKAVNVLVDEYGRAAVADFGFATLKKITSTRNSHAGGGTIAGTLRWMAPERLQGGPLTQAVDVYAFSMTCYELMSEGDIPLTDTPDALIYQAVVHNNLRPSRPSRCPQPIWDLMVQCWHPDPLQRPSFAAISVATKNIVKQVSTMTAALQIPGAFAVNPAKVEPPVEEPAAKAAPKSPARIPASSGADTLVVSAGPPGNDEAAHAAAAAAAPAAGAQLYNSGQMGAGSPAVARFPSAVPARPPFMRPVWRPGAFGASARAVEVDAAAAAAAAAAADGAAASAAANAAANAANAAGNAAANAAANYAANAAAVGAAKGGRSGSEDSGFGSGGSGNMVVVESESLPGRRQFHFEQNRPGNPRLWERSRWRPPVGTLVGPIVGSPPNPAPASPDFRVVWNVDGTQQSPAAIPSDPNFRLQFDEGSWGAWVTRMMTGLPLAAQAELQRKMAMIGTSLHDGSLRVDHSAGALADFAEDLKKAVAQAGIAGGAPAMAPSSSSSSTLSSSSSSSSSTSTGSLTGSSATRTRSAGPIPDPPPLEKTGSFGGIFDGWANFFTRTAGQTPSAGPQPPP
ncbi:hypothetical protein DFJ73DRAFT_662118, partial [Zopfochytrium polystomum]